MTHTIKELIDQLNTIDNKDQPYIGVVWIAEDFNYETPDGSERAFTPEQLAKVSGYRGIDKSITYLYDEVYNYLDGLREEADDNEE
jgi:hypothetical protein